MDITYWVLAIIVSAIFGLIAIMNSKTKVRKTLGWIAGIALVIGLVMMFALPNAGLAFAGGKISTFAIAGAGVAGGQNVNTGTGTTIVTTNPTIAFSGSDKGQVGTSVFSNYYASVYTSATDNGNFGAINSPTTAVPGQKIDFLIANGTSYHSTILKGLQINAGSFPYSVQFDKNASMTENVYTTTGVVLASGTQNQTNLGNGASYNFKDEMTAGALTSTNDMVCVIEIEAGNNASVTPIGATLALNGANIALKSTSKPVWYSVLGTNSNVYLFDVPAISTTATQTFTIGLNAKSTGAFTATTRAVKGCYTKEHFIDPNTGELSYDVADSNGAMKSMALYTKTIVFQ